MEGYDGIPQIYGDCEEQLNRFVIYLELNEGYRKCQELENTTKVKLYVESECRANVDRLANKLFANNEAVSEWEVWSED